VRVVQKPWKGFKYSAGGYLAMQQLVEDATGRTLVDLARENLGEVAQALIHPAGLVGIGVAVGQVLVLVCEDTLVQVGACRRAGA
jgi:hypothetical protein